MGDTVVTQSLLAQGFDNALFTGGTEVGRDPELNADPTQFNVSREKAQHLAFGGGGAHFCLGNQLAKLELRVLFEELLRRIPDMRIAGPITRLQSGFSNELTSMPVIFTPGKREK